MAKSGGMELLGDIIFNTSKEKIKVKASTIPIAKFKPIPPLFFCEEIESAKMLKMKIETGIAVLVCNSLR